MFKWDEKEMALIYAIKKKIGQEGTLCDKSLIKQSTWSRFKKTSLEKKVILYGAGEMFDYYCRIYGNSMDICYVVDRRVKNQEERNGLSVFGINKLESENKDIVVLITVINGINEIVQNLSDMGIQNFFLFPAMEYHRFSIRMKVFWAKINRNYTYKYQVKYEFEKLQQKTVLLEKTDVGLRKRIDILEKRIQGLQQRQTERYLYLLHTNRVMNMLIDKSADVELKKAQIQYLFTNIHKNTYEPDFDNPKTYNEKMVAMMLYEDNPLYAEVTDKVSFKKYVAEKIGEKYVVPLLGVWDDPNEIRFSDLPKGFVLKGTNGGDSNRVILVKDKDEVNYTEIINRLKSWGRMVEDTYYYSFNGTFKNIKQRFIAEEMLDIEDLPYYDYKVHCFHGEPKFIHVVQQNPHELAHYDTEWDRLNIVHGYPDMHCDVPKPDCLDEMLEISRILAEPFKYVRVDFYVLKDRIYVGELTLTTMGGLAPFEPMEVDYEWGDLI